VSGPAGLDLRNVTPDGTIDAEADLIRAVASRGWSGARNTSDPAADDAAAMWPRWGTAVPTWPRYTRPCRLRPVWPHQPPQYPKYPQYGAGGGGRNCVTPREALPLQTVGKLVSPRLKAIACARRLIITAEFLR
jgi:hypothetical protein